MEREIERVGEKEREEEERREGGRDIYRERGREEREKN